MRAVVLLAVSLVLAACSKKEPPKTDQAETTSGPIASPMVEKGDAKDGGAPQGVTVDPRALPAAPSSGTPAVDPQSPVDLAAGGNPTGLRGARASDMLAPTATADRAVVPTPAAGYAGTAAGAAAAPRGPTGAPPTSTVRTDAKGTTPNGNAPNGNAPNAPASPGAPAAPAPGGGGGS